MTLTDFLLARISEDEAVARAVRWHGDGLVRTALHDGGAHVTASPARVLAECEAKRRIVERFKWAADDPGLYRNDMELMDQWQGAMDTLTDLALPYADHPDYREEWRP